MTKIKKLKCFDIYDMEKPFKFAQNLGYYDELTKRTFARNRCPNCLESFLPEEIKGGNYWLWFEDKQSFLNIDDYENNENPTKLLVLFKIIKITHKICQKRLEKDEGTNSINFYNHETGRTNPREFLKDKEYWIEERANEFILFVKYKGKTYQSSVSKKRAKMFKDNIEVKSTIVEIALGKIQLQISRDENLAILRKNWEENKDRNRHDE